VRDGKTIHPESLSAVSKETSPLSKSAGLEHADEQSSSDQAQTLSLHVINAEEQPIPNAVIFVRTVP